MLPYFADKYGNPSSIHSFGGLLRREIDRAREHVAALLGADPTEIFFTSCGTESDNTALQGFARQHGSRTKIVASAVEHPAVRTTSRRLRSDGAAVEEIGVDGEGMLDQEQLGAVDIDGDTLVSLMWANNETGVIFPVRQLSEQVKEKGGWFHTDAVQAVGKVPIDLRDVPIDMLALSGHKVHAPKGVGALYLRKGTQIPPLLLGGHQEEGMRAGTENVAYIVGLGRACELARERMREERTRLKRMRDRLEEGLLARCRGAKLNGHKQHRLPNTTNVSFEFIEGEAILLMLDEKSIAASSGSACTTGSLEPSHVMRAMGVPYTLAHSSIRFSLSRYTTEKEIDTVLEEMPQIVDRLRELSPYVM